METLSTAGIPVWFDKNTQAYCVQPGFRFSKLDPTKVDLCNTASPPVHDLLVQARRVLKEAMAQMTAMLLLSAGNGGFRKDCSPTRSYGRHPTAGSSFF